ncbi:MAG: LamG domain-containing protein [Bacteroidetes bacterium]|nr:LamG domain-containing protein [Bacteroidota bacterium]
MKNSLIQKTGFAVGMALFAISCQKMERPALADYPKDANPPGGPLKFYVAFDGTSADPLRNAVDSVRANFAASNPLASIAGKTGKGVKGATAKDKAIKYSAPNDWANSTSFTIAYWMKNVPATDGEPEFHFSLPSKDFWHSSALFFLVEKGGPASGNSTPTQMACKLAIKDKWVEFLGGNRLPNALNGNWHHIAFTYNETDSKVTAYVDGAAVPYSGSGNIVMDGGSPMGPVKFWNAAKDNLNSFVVAGWNKHVGGLPGGFGGPQDGWIHSYSGDMDQFRLYGKALSATEILALYNSGL